jgi:hypothetical protein
MKIFTSFLFRRYSSGAALRDISPQGWGTSPHGTQREMTNLGGAYPPLAIREQAIQKGDLREAG